MYVFCLFLSFVGFLAPVYAASQEIFSSRPKNVPNDYVITPNGYFHPSCVHTVQNDEIVLPGLIIEKQNGERRALEKCKYSNFSRAGQERKPEKKLISPSDMVDGWKLDASYQMENSLGILSASWVVPADPAINQGQSVAFFPGVQQIPLVSILQPVLDWNNYGIPGWTLVSWNCCEAGTTYHSVPVLSFAGDIIQGTVAYDAPTGGYTVKTTGRNGSTSLKTRSYLQTVNQVFGAAMEVNGVQSCDGLPASRSIKFYNISVFDMNGRTVNQPFIPTYIGNECNYNISIRNGSPSEITFNF